MANNFKDDNEMGKVGEVVILNRMQKKYPNAYIDDTGKANSDWDIWIPEINEGIEVKMDYKSVETGNLLLEVEMNDKLSALSVSKATIWVFITGYLYLWTNPLDVYRFIEQNPQWGRTLLRGKGDNSTKLAHLVPLAIFKEYLMYLPDKRGIVEKIKKSDKLYFDNLEQQFNHLLEYPKYHIII